MGGRWDVRRVSVVSRLVIGSQLLLRDGEQSLHIVSGRDVRPHSHGPSALRSSRLDHRLRGVLVAEEVDSNVMAIAGKAEGGGRPRCRDWRL